MSRLTGVAIALIGHPKIEGCFLLPVIKEMGIEA
jgi:hypothetical protein